MRGCARSRAAVHSHMVGEVLDHQEDVVDIFFHGTEVLACLALHGLPIRTGQHVGLSQASILYADTFAVQQPRGAACGEGSVKPSQPREAAVRDPRCSSLPDFHCKPYEWGHETFQNILLTGPHFLFLSPSLSLLGSNKMVELSPLGMNGQEEKELSTISQTRDFQNPALSLK